MDHTTNESSQSTWDEDEEHPSYGHKRHPDETDSSNITGR